MPTCWATRRAGSIYDGGALIASGGTLLAAGPRLSFAPWHVTSAVVDVAATRMSTARLTSFEPELGRPNPLEVACPFVWPEVEPEVAKPQAAAWETSPNLKEEEFTRAVAWGFSTICGRAARRDSWSA